MVSLSRLRTCAAALVAGAALFVTGCASPTPEARLVAFAEVRDAAGGAAVPADRLAAGLPQSFLVAGAADVAAGVKERARLVAAYPDRTFVFVVDASALAELDAVALADGLLTEALDDARPVYVDRKGDAARSLRDGGSALLLVRVNAERRVVAATVVPADVAAEKAALGIAAP